MRYVIRIPSLIDSLESLDYFRPCEIQIIIIIRAYRRLFAFLNPETLQEFFLNNNVTTRNGLVVISGPL